MRLAAAWLLAAGLLQAGRAFAHPGPGAPPAFVPGDCVTVVDTRETDSFAFDYNVDYDDTTFGVGEIHLPDSKTHQFFAFSGAVVGTPASGYQLFPFDPAIDQSIAMPLWLDQDDVERAAGAAGPIDMTNFTADQVMASSVLAGRGDVTPYLFPLGGKDTRVPITEDQARMGVHWSLAGVAAGVYSFGGYVFSPPFNDWAMRSGVVKVIDGQRDVPAATLESIDAFLYAGQGRRVHGCVSAAAGSTLRAWVRSEEQPGSAWEPWLEPQPIDGDSIDLCLLNPAPGRAGLLRVRIEVTAPDGEHSVAYSPDTVLAVATAAGCTESAKTCCPAASSSTAAPPMTPPAGTPPPVVAGSAAPPPPVTAGSPAAEPPPAIAPGAQPATNPTAGTAASPTQQSHQSHPSGCAIPIGPNGADAHGATGWLTLLVMLILMRSLRSRSATS
jgi:hypothetical protein